MLRKILSLTFLLGMCFTAGAQTQLKVATFNIKSFEGDNFKVEPYAEHLRAENPDIICLNEVENRSNRLMIGNNQRDVVAELAGQLNMFGLFGYSYNKDNKDGHSNESEYTYCQNDLYGNAILSRYPILNANPIRLPRPTGSADQRSVVVADILLPEGKIVRVACTHLDHVGGQLEQAKELVKEDVLSTTAPTLLCGDLNVGPADDVLKTLETVYMRLDDNTGTFYGSSKLDYILGTKDKFELVETKVMDRYSNGIELSDHSAVISTVKIK